MAFPDCEPLAEDSATKLQRGQLTVKSWAYDLVWLNVCYFTASWQGGGERGSGAISSPYHYTTWIRDRGREGVAFPPLAEDQNCTLMTTFTQVLFVPQSDGAK